MAFNQHRFVTFIAFCVAISFSGSIVAGRIIKPSTSEELQRILDTASEGDIVQLLPKVYEGTFVIRSNGGTLTGDTNSTLVGGGLTVNGSGWKIKSLAIKDTDKGLVIEGQDNTIEGVVLQKTGQAITLRGQKNTVKSCVISEAENGILVDTSDHSLYYNSVNIQTPSILVGINSCCNTLDGNVANGKVNIDGPKNRLNGNVCNHGLYVTGCDNEFSGNVANGASFPTNCAVIDKGGNVYRGLGPNDSDLPRPSHQSTNHQNPPNFSMMNPNFYQPVNRPMNGGGFYGTSTRPVPVQMASGPNQPKCRCSCDY